jgi:hypothetical protein
LKTSLSYSGPTGATLSLLGYKFFFASDTCVCVCVCVCVCFEQRGLITGQEGPRW